jgi:hemerythrin superfamily protein
MSIGTTIKKATRSVEKAITGVDPEMDILDTLAEEHEEVAALLQELVDAENSAKKRSLVKKIKAALVPHARAEEQVLYDAIIAVKDKKTKTDGEEGYIEHHIADTLLEDLGRIRDAMSPEFAAAAKVLKEMIEHHVKEEESTVWSDVKKNYDGEQRKAMNREYLALKAQVKIPA